MSKKKNGKNSKRISLRSSLLVLLLIAILLIASTYAWFTANTVVTISTLDVHVETKGGLQISADGINWKTILSNDDINPTTVSNTYSGNTNQIPTTLEPCSTDGTVDSGTMNMFYGTVTAASAAGTDYKAGDFVLTASKQADAKGTNGKYIAFDVFLKVDKDETLTLTKSSDVTAKKAGAEVEDRGLKNAARVAFVQSTGVAADGSDSTTIQALVPTTSYIWEPNYDVHTSPAVSAASSIYGITTTTTGGSKLAYNGVKAEIATPVALNSKDTTYFAAVTPKISTTAANTTDNELMAIKKGITKVRIYMWIEGQDVDCENNASGSDIAFDVQFSIPTT